MATVPAIGDYYEWWLGGGDWYDRGQQREIDALAESGARERTRMASKMRKQTGDLQAQIDQLRTALVAAIELQTMQGQLAEYADAAAARRYARDIVALLATGPRDDTGPPIVPTDVPSYWLPPAVRAVVARTSGDDAEADELVDLARGRDPERTDRFLTLLAGVLRRADLANELEAQLPRTAKVTPIQRALWTAVAEGRYGDGASDVLVHPARRGRHG